MQNILDRTPESLAEAFASLARNARRQQRLYFATIAVLLIIVAFSASLVAVLAVNKQLNLQRMVAARNASDVSLFLHRGMSFLIRTELTVQFYQQTPQVRDAPGDLVAQIRRAGVATIRASGTNTPFDVLVGNTTRDAWGAELDAKLWRIREAAEATLATREAFQLPYRALLIGLDEDYAAILPGVDARTALQPPSVAQPPLAPQLAATLRATLLSELAAQTGRRMPANGERVLVGPYRDPLLGGPAVSALSVYRADDKPAVLIVLTIPANAFLAGLHEPANSASVLLVSAQQRPLAAPPPPAASLVQMLRDAARHIAPGGARYTAGGAVFVDPVTPGYSALVSYVSWGTVLAALALQLTVIAALGLLLMVAMALTAKFWGMRLLRDWHDESLHALESETLNHIVVSATPVGLCIVRQRDFSLVTSNRRARQLLQLGDAACLPPHVMKQMARSVRARADAQRAKEAAEFMVSALPGQDEEPDARQLQINYAAARHGDEDVFFCGILDVTARYALGLQLRAAKRETDAMMRAQSSFFAAMSHEIRTPMNALLGNLELLSRSPGLEPHRQRLRAVGIAADGLRRIVSDILDLSKMDAGKMKLVSEPFVPLDDFESLALSHAPLVAGRPLRFRAYLAPALGEPLCGDRTRVVQIVNNLLNNAFKFTTSGKITLDVRVDDAAPGRKTLTCRVSDSGIGMDALQTAQIFKPFVQAEASTSNRFGGTGLGLSICARLCELMGGKIAVESVPGVGSAFTATLVVDAFHQAHEAHEAVPDAHDAPAQAVPKCGNVFVLCREAGFARWLEGVLALRGWLANSATSLDAAQSWLRVNRPALLIVTDEFGAEAVAALRAVRAVNVVRMTPDGPHRPHALGDGLFEVTEYSQSALAAALELAAGGVLPAEAWPEDGRRDSAVAGQTAATQAFAPSASAKPTADTPAAPSALQGLRVLVAEDNPLNQALIDEQLATLGCVPIVVGDGKDALALLTQNEVDLVMTDIHMPVMNGYALMAAIRNAYPALPVVAFSAVSGAEQVQEWRERGFAAHISKPASLAQLEAALLSLRSSGPAAQCAALPVASGPESGPAAADDMLDAPDKVRYMAMLKEHLSSDLPLLAGIVDDRDRVALRDWAHSAGGAFLIVREPRFAEQCRELQRICEAAGTWTPVIAQRALALHDDLRSHFFGLDEPTLH